MARSSAPASGSGSGCTVHLSPSLAGGVTATVKFAAAFEQDAELAVLLGMINGTEVTWQPLEAKVEEDGSLTISLTAEQAKAVQDGVAVIAVLQKAIAE